MIEALIVALILCAIIAVVAWGLTKVIPFPPPVGVVIQVIAAVICLVILLRVFLSTDLPG